MIRCEIRKLLQRSYTRIILLVLVAANALLVWNQQLPGTEQYYNMDARHILSLYAALPEEPEQALKALEQRNDSLLASIIQETDAGVLLTPDIYTERKLFSNVIERVEPIAHYDAILNEIDENAETLLLTGRYEPNSFGYRNILKSQEQYRGLTDVQPEILYSGAIELLPGGRITDFVVILLCLLVGLELICSERITGTMALIKPTFQGVYPLIAAKILAGLFLALTGTFVLYGTNLVIGLIRCGMISLKAPIQSVFGFLRSPWEISIAMYILGFFCMKSLWASSVTAIVYLSCSIGNRVLESCGIFLLTCAPSLVMQKSVLSLLSTGNTVGLFSEYRNLNLFGWPISSFSVCILVMMLVSAVCFGFTAAIHIRSSPTVPDRKRKQFRKTRRFSVNLLLHEARKLFLLNGAIWVLIVLIAVQLLGYLNFDAWISPQERLYMQYSEKLSGPADQEKDAFIAGEAARFAELHGKMDEYSHALSSGQMKQEAYEALCSGIMRQLDSEEVFLRAKDQYDRMKRLGYDYVCQTGYERLLGPEGQRDAVVLAIRLMLALILGLASIHSIETESNMVFLLNSVPCKRDSLRMKWILATVYAIAAAVITFVPHLLAMIHGYGLPGLSASGNSVPLLRMGTRTVFGGLCIYAVAIIALSILAAHVISLISKKAGSSTGTIIMSSVLLLVPFGTIWLLSF